MGKIRERLSKSFGGYESKIAKIRGKINEKNWLNASRFFADFSLFGLRHKNSTKLGKNSNKYFDGYEILPEEEKKIGAIAEQVALNYLQNAGLKFITQNFTTRFGEIDLVMRDKKQLVFVEVRLRTNTKFGDGVLSITKKKQVKLTNTANVYLQKHGEQDFRFDVVSMNRVNNKLLVEKWIKYAF